jgi:hypothetical protein
MNGDRASVVHACAVVADRAVNFDVQGLVDPDGDRMGAARIQHLELRVIHALRNCAQRSIEVAKTMGGEIEG